MIKLFSNYFNKTKVSLDTGLLLGVFALQLVVWFFIAQVIKPDFTITPYPPSKAEMNIVSLGDQEFGYRAYGQILQNAGDTFGETIPLKDYDFAKLEQWFYAVDSLNRSAEYVPSIAAFYYGQSQNVLDCEYVIRYLVNHANYSPADQWRWYLESVYLAAYRMENYEIARPIAEKLISIKDPKVPLWAKTIVPFVMQKKGDICGAYEMLSLMTEEDFAEITSDAIMSSGNNAHNDTSNFIIEKIKMIRDNPDAVKACILEKKKKNRS